jgi:hypothetical protein
MALHIAHRLGIRYIKVLMNKACPAKTLVCSTLKDMGLPVLNILNGWDGLEKYVDR